MRVLLLSDVNSTHTQKWAVSLKNAGVVSGLFSITEPKVPWCQDHGIPLFLSRWQQWNTLLPAVFTKTLYLMRLPSLRRAIKDFRPDIIHAHYASSYGFLGALSGFHPFVLSVWGTDIFDFPNISFVHKMIIKFNLSKADKILSTSNVMVRETEKYTNKEIEVTPFGVDLAHFKLRTVDSIFDNDAVVIGTVKTLEPKYGIRDLLKAFKIVKENNQNLPVKLLVVGGGPEEKVLKKLAKDLSIHDDTVFTGSISSIGVSEYYNMISIFVALSIKESFGVAIVEAQATEKPVVVSNSGGLPEVVEDGVTGIVVESKNPDAAAKAIEYLVHNRALGEKMGKLGRKRVKQIYDWKNNVEQMVDIYNRILRSLSKV
ncbi:MAG: glycosyltransferase [Bacteroidales bacterium]|nr:glycosyltransferase [Bacteroidota bacterium]MBL6949965.1 glycosyltransferase [Bacteroidales bacterium]